jgi:hypothetical protein
MPFDKSEKIIRDLIKANIFEVEGTGNFFWVSIIKNNELLIRFVIFNNVDFWLLSETPGKS